HLVRHHLHLFVDFVILTPHESLNGVNRILGVGYSLSLRNLPNETLATLGECDDRRRRATTLLVCNDDRFSALHNGYDGVCGPQVDSYNLAHRKVSLLQPVLIAIRNIRSI